MEQKIWEPGGEVDRGFKRLIAQVWKFRTTPLFSATERVTLDFAIAAAPVPNGVTDEMFAELRSHCWSAGKHAPSR